MYLCSSLFRFCDKNKSNEKGRIPSEEADLNFRDAKKFYRTPIIGYGVMSIGQRAFAYCSELLDVYCYAEKVPSTKSNAFDGSYPEYATLHVPDASIDSYKATAPWSGFGKIVPLTEEETGIDEQKGENIGVKTGQPKRGGGYA